MAVEEPEPDTFGPETGGDYQDDPAWNESESGLDETNETEENESSDESDEVVSTTITLDTLACDADAGAALPTDAHAQTLNTSNVTVWHNPDPTFYPGYELNIDDSVLPGGVTGQALRRTRRRTGRQPQPPLVTILTSEPTAARHESGSTRPAASATK